MYNNNKTTFELKVSSIETKLIVNGEKMKSKIQNKAKRNQNRIRTEK